MNMEATLNLYELCVLVSLHDPKFYIRMYWLEIIPMVHWWSVYHGRPYIKLPQLMANWVFWWICEHDRISSKRPIKEYLYWNIMHSQILTSSWILEYYLYLIMAESSSDKSLWPNKDQNNEVHYECLLMEAYLPQDSLWYFNSIESILFFHCAWLNLDIYIYDSQCSDINMS